MTPLDHLKSAQAKHIAAVAEGLLAFARRHPAFVLGVGAGLAAMWLAAGAPTTRLAPLDGDRLPPGRTAP